jgi:DNA repair protein RecO (recombination protein O)
LEHKYTGIVLGKRDIGEADRIYTFYTLEMGKVKAIARGVRRSHAKLAGHLENFCLIDFTVMKNRGIGNISSAIVEENFSKIRNDFEILRSVFDVLGSFDMLVNDEEKDLETFSLLWGYLNVLNKNTDKFEILTQGFMFKLFDVLGYGISSHSCVHCQGKIQNGENIFDYQLGGIGCENCAPNVINKTTISDNTIKLLRIFASNQIKSLRKLDVSKKDVDDLRLLSCNFLKWIN